MASVRCLSTKLWLVDMCSIRLFCLLIVVSHCTWQTSATSNNTTPQPCSCNTTDLVQKTCNCSGNLTTCQDGYFWSKNGCILCMCNTTKSPCDCPNNSTSEITCQNGYFLHNTSDEMKCVKCECNPSTSTSLKCDNITAQCICKPHFMGLQCNKCRRNYTSVFAGNGSLLNCIQCSVGLIAVNKSTSPFYECKKPNSTVLPILTKVPKPPSTSISPSSSSIFTKMKIPATSTSQIASETSQTMNIQKFTIPSLSIPNILTSSVTTHSLDAATTFTLVTPDITSSSRLATTSTVNIPIGEHTMSKFTVQLTIDTHTTQINTQPISQSTTKPTTTSKPTPTRQSTTSIIYTSPKQPPSTKPITTNKPITKRPTTSEHTDEPTQRTDHFTSQTSTDRAKVHSDDNTHDIVTIVLVTIGVLLVLCIAIALGCWYMRATRKPSAPFWTVELSNTARNDEHDFALLDPVTDQPHDRLYEEDEMDTPVDGSTRYCAYI